MSRLFSAAKVIESLHLLAKIPFFYQSQNGLYKWTIEKDMKLNISENVAPLPPRPAKPCIAVRPYSLLYIYEELRVEELRVEELKS